MTGSTTFMLTRRRDLVTEPELGGMITRHLVIMVMVMMMIMMMMMMMMCHLSTLMETTESMMTWLGRSCSIGSR